MGKAENRLASLVRAPRSPTLACELAKGASGLPPTREDLYR